MIYIYIYIYIYIVISYSASSAIVVEDIPSLIAESILSWTTEGDPYNAVVSVIKGEDSAPVKWAVILDPLSWLHSPMTKIHIVGYTTVFVERSTAVFVEGSNTGHSRDQ